jgi:hypothetical protein
MRGLLLAIALLAGAGGARAADDWRITTAGYGPAKIGMTVAEASAALGTKLVSEGPVDEPSCHYMRPEPAVEGLWFMISDDHVVRVEVTTAGVRPAAGSASATTRRGGRELPPASDAHKYVAPDGNYLTVWSAGRKAAVRFETLQGRSRLLRRPRARSGICRGLVAPRR